MIKTAFSMKKGYSTCLFVRGKSTKNVRITENNKVKSSNIMVYLKLGDLFSK